MEENKMIEEVNEGVMDTVYNEVSNSNSKLPIIGGIVMLLGIAGTVYGVMRYRKKKNSCKFESYEVIDESKEAVEDDNEITE